SVWDEPQDAVAKCIVHRDIAVDIHTRQRMPHSRLKHLVTAVRYLRYPAQRMPIMLCLQPPIQLVPRKNRISADIDARHEPNSLNLRKPGMTVIDDDLRWDRWRYPFKVEPDVHSWGETEIQEVLSGMASICRSKVGGRHPTFWGDVLNRR